MPRSLALTPSLLAPRPRRKEDDTDALLRFQGIMYLKELGENIRKTSLCGLGQTAGSAVASAIALGLVGARP